VWGGEDYDINLRAIKHGFRGKFVKDAWVWHDQSHLNSIEKVLKKRYRYFVGAAIAYLKNGKIGAEKRVDLKKHFGFFHPIEVVSLILKPIAFIEGYIRWRKLYTS